MPHSNTAKSLADALVILAIIFSVFPVNAAEQDGIKIGRYSTMPPIPPASQVNPLNAIVFVNFPRERVATVGDAVNYLLLRSGYHLDAQQTEVVRSILALPLPEVHRQVGSYSVQTALKVLMGQSYSLSVDHAHRSVLYKLAATDGGTTSNGVASMSTANDSSVVVQNIQGAINESN